MLYFFTMTYAFFQIRFIKFKCTTLKFWFIKLLQNISISKIHKFHNLILWTDNCICMFNKCIVGSKVVMNNSPSYPSFRIENFSGPSWRKINKSTMTNVFQSLRRCNHLSVHNMVRAAKKEKYINCTYVFSQVWNNESVVLFISVWFLLHFLL